MFVENVFIMEEIEIEVVLIFNFFFSWIIWKVALAAVDQQKTAMTTTRNNTNKASPIRKNIFFVLHFMRSSSH